MKTEYDDEDLGIFILDDQCAEMEQLINILVTFAICVPIIVFCVYGLTEQSIAS